MPPDAERKNAHADIPRGLKENNGGIFMKVTIVYWSGAANTEVMAIAVAEGAKNAGA